MEKDLENLKKDFSNDLKNIFKFMEEDLMSELPTPTLDSSHFIYSILTQKNNKLYRRLEENITTMALDAIHDSYYDFISSKSVSAIKPSRKIKYSDELVSFIDKSKLFMEMCNDKEITTEHVFLAIMSDDSEDNKIRKVFIKSGIMYDDFLNKIKNNKKSDTDSNLDKDNTREIKMIKVKSLDDLKKIKGLEQLMDGFDSDMQSQFKTKQKFIENYCTNLNNLVDQDKIDALVGRDREVNEIIRILGRRKKNNAILIGGEGVGKTAIAESIAYKIVHGEVPRFLLSKVIVSLDMTALMAGTTLRGMFEERVKGILDEVKNNKNYILFIDNIGAVLADKGKNDYDISSMLSRSLENGECQVIGTSDFNSYRKTFDKDPSLARRFQKIVIDAPSKEDSKKILFGIKESYEKYHKVKYSDEAINACIELASRYITERNLPDSAIDILDEAGSLYGTVVDSDEILVTKIAMDITKKMIAKCKSENNYEEADKAEAELVRAKKKYNEAVKKSDKEKEENPYVISENDILDVVSNKTGIPVNQLTSDDKKKLATINDRLKSEVIGQDEAIDTICKALKRSRIGLHSNGCTYSALMIGKTGVGKTLIAKKLAKELFGSEQALVRFDMSEYPDKTSVNKLIGSNPGYVGYEEGGKLTETIKNKKYCVLLLDEIEKADPEVYNIFLQVLDEGFLTDNSGMKVDFSNVVVLFTSNVGAKAASDFSKGIGFNNDENENSKRILLKSLRNQFPPEFLNRINNVIYFNSLTDDNLKEIIKLELNKCLKRINEIGYKIEYEDNVIDELLKIVKEEKEFGARPVIRAIQDNIEDLITDLIISEEINNENTLNISCSSDNSFVIK